MAERKDILRLKTFKLTIIEKFTAHIGMHVISILALVLVRLQNGIMKDLTYRGGLI